MTCAFRPLPLPSSLLSLIQQHCLGYGYSTSSTARPFITRNGPYALSRRYHSSSFANPNSKNLDHRNGWQPVIGLELHVQLKSPVKLFSPAHTSFDEVPNTQVALFDAAIPGSLPVLNPEPVKLALKAAIALGCKIRRKSKFDRKHYFYPDLPNGYQITQKYSAFANDGIVKLTPRHDGLEAPRDVRISQVQLEQDTAKSMHDTHTSTTLIDLNRAGTALIEIVSEPDMRDSKQAAAYVRKVQSLLRCTGASTADMEKGSLRIDVNVSVFRPGSTELGRRCEIKNLNSIRSMVDAIEHEVDRHIGVLTSDSNAQVEQETRGFDALLGTTYKLRSKADTPDYRYMPDPDLAPLVIPEYIIEKIEKSLPELPDAKRERLEMQYGLKQREVDILVKLDEALEDDEGDGMEESRAGGVSYFEQVAKGRDARTAANWVIHDLLGLLAKHEKSFADNPVEPNDLGALIDAVESNKINGTTGKALLASCVAAPTPSSLSARLVDAIQATSSSNTDYTELCQRIIEKLPAEADKVRKGNTKVIARLVGEGMKETQGRGDAKQLRKVLEELLLP